MADEDLKDARKVIDWLEANGGFDMPDLPHDCLLCGRNGVTVSYILNETVIEHGKRMLPTTLYTLCEQCVDHDDVPTRVAKLIRTVKVPLE